MIPVFVHECVENVIDGAADEGTMRHELAVHAMQDRLQVISLTWILRIEQREELR